MLTAKTHQDTVSAYCEEHDAHYDPARDEWLESPCDDPQCCFCVDRPERPSGVIRDKLMKNR
jgi:hypothetical protein